MIGHIGRLPLLPVVVVAVTGVYDGVAAVVVVGMHQLLQSDDDGEHESQSGHHEGLHGQKTHTADAEGCHHLAHHQAHHHDAGTAAAAAASLAAAAAAAASSWRTLRVDIFNLLSS